MKARIRVQENGMDKNSIVFYDIIEYLFVIRGQVNIGRFHCLQTVYSTFHKPLFISFKKNCFERELHKDCFYHAITMQLDRKRNAFSTQFLSNYQSL